MISDDSGQSELVRNLRRQGIKNARVLEAIQKTPRKIFVEEKMEWAAYNDQALPIACGQTISQPYVVAKMTEALDVAPDMRVLEIGTGSGYQTAVLARLAGTVYTIERHRVLLAKARKHFQTLALNNIIARHGDGYQGWYEQAPFDRILVTAAFSELPEALIEQLKIGGILVAPVGYESISQRLLKMIRTAKGVSTEVLLPVVFVPMVPGLPQEEHGSDEDNDQS